MNRGRGEEGLGICLGKMKAFVAFGVCRKLYCHGLWRYCGDAVLHVLHALLVLYVLRAMYVLHVLYVLHALCVLHACMY